MRINHIITDTDRIEHKPTIDRMYQCLPMAFHKIGDAIVQQAYVYDLAKQYAKSGSRILSAGSYQDTAAELLRFDGYAVYDVDPVINYDLHTFAQLALHTYNVIISTSVLEHTNNDEEFIDDCCRLLAPGGVAIFTMDFKDDWTPGQPVPYTSNRFYRVSDLTGRLAQVLARNGCSLVSTPDYSAKDRFIWDGINYSFASWTFKKG